ncbi:hypothetical protein [Jiangella asiatica]|uniref:Uncharacterized protein n=1 Tax=Jiangella asiatica TaxID=2530372 RepID=A0A4V2Z3W6_9ACTN|nr:hypothetical protein [Jiangella asiatica]TDE14238.1 hypothetical protein E1269_03540 [Jiangella asiatica]
MFFIVAHCDVVGWFGDGVPEIPVREVGLGLRVVGLDMSGVHRLTVGRRGGSRCGRQRRADELCITVAVPVLWSSPADRDEARTTDGHDSTLVVPAADGDARAVYRVQRHGARIEVTSDRDDVPWRVELAGTGNVVQAEPRTTYLSLNL